MPANATRSLEQPVKFQDLFFLICGDSLSQIYLHVAHEPLQSKVTPL